MPSSDLIERLALPGTERIAAAVSGGADSVFLLHALHRLGRATAVLHVNHHLRGAESDEDERFVRDLAASFNLPFRVHHTHNLPEGNLEQEARRARHAFFAESPEPVATGHTMDDQAETVLYRFLRGAGTAGLSGIRPSVCQQHNSRTVRIVRPLLQIRRREIRQWLTDHGKPWREDSSNASMAFARNRLRTNYLPGLAADINPALVETLAATAEWARSEEDYWTDELNRLALTYLIQEPQTVIIEAEQFRRIPVAAQRRLLRRGIEHIRGNLRSIDFRHIEAVRALMASTEGSGRLQLPGLDIYRSFDWLRLAPPGFDTRIARDFEVFLTVPGRTRENLRALTIEVELVEGPRVYNDDMVGLDGERCAGPLLLRNWRPGDRLQPRGRSGSEKIKTLFQESGIPLWERRQWPVILNGDAIIWTRGFGIDRNYAAGPGSRSVLTIREITESKPTHSTSIELRRARRQSASWGVDCKPNREEAEPNAGL